MVKNMINVKIYESVVNEDIKSEIKEADWCTDLIQYTTSKCKIDGLIASAFLFCPQIMQVNDYVFIKKFWNCSVESSEEQVCRLEKQYDYNKKSIEMSVNTWSIGDFFVGDSDELMDNEKVIQQFGEAIVYFWKCRVKELFPEKKIVVELGNNLMGEIGLCVTMYQAE